MSNLLSAAACRDAVTRLVAVVLNWNRRDDTRACLTSLAASTLPLHVVVVDNGSTECKPHDLVDGFEECGLDLTLVENETNEGFARGMNRGMDRALKLGADAVWALNNDVVVDAEAAGRLLNALDDHPEAAVVSPLVYDARAPDRLSNAGGRLELSRGRTHHREEGAPRSAADAPFDVDYVEGSAPLFRADDLRVQGGYDEAFGAYWEDVDWCLTARARGRRVLVAHEARVWHHVSASSGVHAEYALTHRARNRFLVARKHGGFTTRLLLPVRALADIPVDAYHLRRASGGWEAPRAWVRGTLAGLLRQEETR